MKKRTIQLTLIAIMVSMLGFYSCKEDEKTEFPEELTITNIEEEGGDFEITLSDSSENGLANIQVRLLDEDHNAVEVTKTDSVGKINFGTLKSGNYWIIANDVEVNGQTYDIEKYIQILSNDSKSLEIIVEKENSGGKLELEIYYDGIYYEYDTTAYGDEYLEPEGPTHKYESLNVYLIPWNDEFDDLMREINNDIDREIEDKLDQMNNYDNIFRVYDKRITDLAVLNGTTDSKTGDVTFNNLPAGDYGVYMTHAYKNYTIGVDTLTVKPYGIDQHVEFNTKETRVLISE